ncbi:MAG: ketoacyl-ACP synthase III [Saprospiraceae bacterium]|nr:ketoacyl-ACP synthase III [Saprospiraceae bacterium]
MIRSKIAGIGHYVPEKVITNHDLERLMETSDEWIQERTGIQERRFGNRAEETTTTMGARAAEKAIEHADIDKNDIDFIVFATLSPDYFFPGCGVLVQRELDIASTEIGALDVRNQCSGFVYGLSVADQFIRSGMYKNILLIGAEMHSMGLDMTTRGRDVSVIFGDGAAAVILQPTEDSDQGVLSTHLHADGRHAEELAFISPGSHGGRYGEKEKYGFPDNEFESVFITRKMIDDGLIYPNMNGKYVFKYAVQKFPAAVMEALTTNGYKPSDLDLLIPHQANLRISQFVQRTLRLEDHQVFNNIQKYGNTTAASIPLALSEAVDSGKVKRGDLICLAAFGSGFTWGSALLKW